ncbi:hypothetical protein BUE80_DR010963 [Diplocarpon rosae]|nr:hypothetical protein BUE80_DR010963 [Diplocarpon rosae]
MAQGTLKSKKLTTATAKASSRRPGVLGPKKGARTGHLELLKGGKKNKDAKEGKDTKGNAVEVRKGGSKKFG